MKIHNRATGSVLLGLALALLAAPTEAKFRATVTKAEGFSKSQLKRVIFVTSQCNETLDCSNMERRIHGELQEMNLGFHIVPEQAVRKILFENGHTEYSPDLRELLSEKLELDGIFELKVPYSERGDGWAGDRRSMVKIEVSLVDQEGRILLHGVGTGRPLNVVSSPERVASNVVAEIFHEAFD